MQVSQRGIVVLGTGGTIAGRAASAADNVGYKAGEVGVADLLSGVVPPAGFALHAEQVANVDSKDMEFAVWRQLALRCAHWLARDDVAGLVITHGTDTMVETAVVLARAVAGKTIVLTGAMIPYAFGSSDGLFNLGSALSFAQVLPAGVYVAMNGMAFPWDRVRKNRQSGVFEAVE